MYDVVVVGAGPAGTSAARRCAQLGLKTVLIDKATFPRNKLCGGAFSDYGISCLDFSLPAEFIERDIYGARVHFGEDVVEAKKPYRLAVTISRFQFDHFLLKKAQELGVEVLQGRKVSALKYENDHIEVLVDKDQYCGLIVIGCDGFNGVTAHYVRRRDLKNEYGMCVEVQIPSDDNITDRYIQDTIDIHLGVVQGGYGWVFPHRGYFSVGIGGFANKMANPTTLMRSFLASLNFETNMKVQGFPIPSGGIKRRTVANRIILAGDAAGFVDTFYGEGIGYAVRSGQLAAEASAIAIRGENCSEQGLSAYVALCEKEFGQHLRYSLYLSRIMNSFPKFFLRLMASSTEAVDKYLEVPARRRKYQQYFMWLLPRIPTFLFHYLTRAQRERFPPS
jgi:geranylgeranyl reductase family protein